MYSMYSPLAGSQVNIIPKRSFSEHVCLDSVVFIGLRNHEMGVGYPLEGMGFFFLLSDEMSP